MKLKKLLNLKSLESDPQRERAFWFHEIVYKKKKATWRKNQRYAMKIDQLEETIKKKAKKIVYHNSATTNLLASMIVSQNVIMKTYELEDNNHLLNGLKAKYLQTKKECEILDQQSQKIKELLRK